MKPQTLEKHKAAQSMVELFSLHDAAFVRCAYHTVLGRDADPSGLEHFVERLRTGTAKIDILTALRLSGEGRQVGLDLGWLDSAIARRRRESLRWIGWLFRIGRRQERDDPHSRRIRALDNNLSRLCDELDRRLVGWENSFDRIEYAVNRQYDALVELASGSGPIAPQASTISGANKQAESSSKRELSPRASRVLRSLRTARATAASKLESST